jgi:hypothetical protein
MITADFAENPLLLPFEVDGERRDLTGAILIVRRCPTEDREEGSQR